MRACAGGEGALKLLPGAAILTGLAGGLLGQPALASGPGLDPLSTRLLVAHNLERRRIGVPPLAWDHGLAASAAAYGSALARLGRLQHSPRAIRPGQRENLWMGRRGFFSPEQMVGTWIAERAYYRPGLFPAVSRTRNWADVAHYTQMIWRTTTRVGCAVHQSQWFDFLICRYSPPGNIDGRSPV